MMICQHYGRRVPLQKARELCDKGQRGVHLLGIHRAAEDLGLRSTAVKIHIDMFMEEAKFPCVLHWKQDHFVIAYKSKGNKIYIADPGVGKFKVDKEEFRDFWTVDGKNGVALFVEPTSMFYQQEEETHEHKGGLAHLLSYVFRFKSLLGQLGLGALVGTLLNMVFPFLTQALVDQGVGNRDVSFIYMILAAQMMLFLGRTATEFIRGWIMVHMGTRINIAVLSDYLTKLMRLPLSYFEKKNLGDVLQRIADHKKIEEFLTSHSINVVFSMLNLVVFSVIMAYYSVTIFLIFFVGSILSIAWVILFLNKRKVVDYQTFRHMSNNQNAVVQIVDGMPEIKLNQSSARRRWEWEGIQGKLFKVRLKSLAIEQYQQAGTLFLNEGRSILITFIAAYQVVNGNLTLGMMMAITYMLGQMNGPIEQVISFITLAQDAKISMDRLSEIQELKEEDHPDDGKITHITVGDINIRNLQFKYEKHETSYILDDIDLVIPHKKTTAIVGASGSGKTTLMKLLLHFHEIKRGDIKIGEHSISNISPDEWRSKCGVVMQDGFIFSESIAKNIAMGNESIDYERLLHAAKTANIHDEVEKMPQGYLTQIGREGVGLSGGQSQRILIARAIYKNPEYLFFDEATSALDAANEKSIRDNLQYFFKGKTAVIIAHRLSTVRNADQIVVLDKGKVIELGTHDELTKNKGTYYSLVKNQLELGS